jgi:hypothetical protein
MKTHYIYCVVIVFVAIMFVWLFRFAMIPSSAGDNSLAYRLDRWTGEVRFFSGYRYIDTERPAK